MNSREDTSLGAKGIPQRGERLAKMTHMLLRYSPLALMITALAIDFAMGDCAHAADGWWNENDPGEFAGGIIRDVHCDMLELVEGSFGGMLTAVAGAMGLVYAALGNPKYSVAAIGVACGCFGMSAGISIYFGDVCGGGGGAGARQAQAIQAETNRALPLEFQLPGFGHNGKQAAAIQTFERAEDTDDPFNNF